MSKLIRRTITVIIIERWCFFWPEAPTTAALTAVNATTTADAALATTDAPATGQRLGVLEVCRISTSTVQTISATAAALTTTEAKENEVKETEAKEVD